MIKVVLVIFIYKIFLFKLAANEMDFEPRNMICENYEEYFKNITCLIKTSRKKPQSFNFIGVLRKPVTHCQVRINIYKNSNRMFPRDLTFDGCSSMAGKKLNPISSRIRAGIKRHSNMNGTCPVEGTVNVLNYSPNMTLLPMFLPRGRFRVNLTFTDYTNSIIKVYGDFVNNKD